MEVQPFPTDVFLQVYCLRINITCLVCRKQYAKGPGVFSKLKETPRLNSLLQFDSIITIVYIVITINRLSPRFTQPQ